MWTQTSEETQGLHSTNAKRTQGTNLGQFRLALQRPGSHRVQRKALPGHYAFLQTTPVTKELHVHPSTPRPPTLRYGNTRVQMTTGPSPCQDNT
jgi:hypothetical protein